MTADIVCNSLYARSDWFRNFSDNGYNIVANSDIIFDSYGNLSYLGTYTLLSEGVFRIDSSISIVTTTFTTGLVLQGGGTLSIQKAGVTIANVTVAYPGKTVLYTAGALVSQNTLTVTTKLTVNGGTFIQNNDLTFETIKANVGSSLIFNAGSTYALTAYISGDLDGTAQTPLNFVSNSYGNQFTFDNPASMEILYITATDSVAVNNIIAYNSTLTNDVNWNNIQSCSSSSSSSCSSSFSSCSSCSCSSSFSSSSFSSSSSSSCSLSFSSSSSSSCSSCSCSSSFSSCSSSSCSSSFSSSSSSSCSSSSCSSSFSSCSSSFSSSSSSSCSFSSSSCSYSSCSCSFSSSSSCSSSHSSCSSSSGSFTEPVYVVSTYQWRAVVVQWV